MTKIPRDEALRYLNAGDAAPELRAQLDDVCAELEQALSPRAVWQEYPCRVEAGQVSIPGAVFPGAALSAHLKGCTALLLLAATLGTEADRLTRMEGLRAAARGAMAHAAGAAMIEQFCDDMQSEIAAAYEARGLYLRPRFSPGYGDLPLQCQRDFFRLLDLPKRLGLSLNEYDMMTPSKSVTAVIGISDRPGKSFRSCIRCARTDCPFRKEPRDETVS